MVTEISCSMSSHSGTFPSLTQRTDQPYRRNSFLLPQYPVLIFNAQATMGSDIFSVLDQYVEKVLEVLKLSAKGKKIVLPVLFSTNLLPLLFSNAYFTFSSSASVSISSMVGTRQPVGHGSLAVSQQLPVGVVLS